MLISKRQMPGNLVDRITSQYLSSSFVDASIILVTHYCLLEIILLHVLLIYGTSSTDIRIIAVL